MLSRLPYPNGSLDQLTEEGPSHRWPGVGQHMGNSAVSVDPGEAPCGQRAHDDRECMTARRCANVLAGGAPSQSIEAGPRAGREGLNSTWPGICAHASLWQRLKHESQR